MSDIKQIIKKSKVLEKNKKFTVLTTSWNDHKVTYYIYTKTSGVMSNVKINDKDKNDLTGEELKVLDSFLETYVHTDENLKKCNDAA